MDLLNKDVVESVTVILSLIAAILAWVAKLVWGHQYAKAKEATIKAKEESIKLLERENKLLKERG
ncbi:MAG: hypothetical protein KJ558_11020 [Gammaproteobacteria bacterium]|nr:hypothetical protein [Gammaproteobacteria bacterium]MBU1655339.1 hypothetical protein [Gammaproteobacteria bacterium]MBU1960982.1 hypothetical protein [Gammaproteobacteria bacterium]